MRESGLGSVPIVPTTGRGLFDFYLMQHSEIPTKKQSGMARQRRKGGAGRRSGNDKNGKF